jgi:hypothetical protein
VDSYSASDEVNLNEIGFKLAFGVIEFYTGKPLNDPDYVEWVVSREVRQDLKLND